MFSESGNGDRKVEEARFHDMREKDRRKMTEEEFLRKYPNKTFYAIDRCSKGFLREWLRARCPGKVVLDYCCGNGALTIQLAEFGAEAYGIDVSGEEIATARRAAREAGLEERTHFKVMDAEAMDFPDGFFDVIVCSGVLHHLDLDRAYPELARVLKSSGEVICTEPLGYNPAINWYRRRTPNLRTAWEADHILTKKDVSKAARFFAAIDVKYFHLFTILAIPFRKARIFSGLLSVLEAIDSVALRIPGIRLLAWQMCMIFSRPR